MTEAINPAVGCHYFPPGPRLPTQPPSITAHWPIPNCTAWWQRHECVCKQLAQGFTRQHGQDSNPRPVDRKSISLTTQPPSHTRGTAVNFPGANPLCGPRSATAILLAELFDNLRSLENVNSVPAFFVGFGEGVWGLLQPGFVRWAPPASHDHFNHWL